VLSSLKSGISGTFQATKSGVHLRVKQAIARRHYKGFRQTRELSFQAPVLRSMRRGT